MNKKHVVSFILFLLPIIFKITTGFDYQCDGNPDNDRVSNFKRCKFLSESQLECIVYGKFFKTVRNQVVNRALKFRILFLVQRKAKFIGKDHRDVIGSSTSWWCMKTSRIDLELIPNIPSSSDDFEFSPNILEELFSIDELRMHISYPEESETSFHFNKSSAFLNLRDECDPEIRPISDGCINLKMLYVRYKLQSKPLNSTKDIEVLRKFYLLQSRGTIEDLTVRSSTIDISLWLNNLQDVTVKQLNLSNNDVGHNFRNKNAFPKLTTLTHLYLSNCGITYFGPDNFYDIKMTEVLDFSYNNLNLVPPKINLLARLRELDLSFQTSRANFKLNIEKELASLVRLRLDGLDIISLSRSSFNKTLPSLKFLSLRSCKITIISEDAFIGMPKLEYLDLSHNQLLTSIHPNSFLPIKSYLSLLLHHCPNLKFSDKLKLSNIKLLDISYCNITKTPNGLISSNSIISYVNLSNNFISTWNNSQSFGSRTLRIKHVNLSYNAIQVINNTMGHALRTIKSIDLGLNPFDCQSCELEQFHTWLSSPNTQFSNLGMNKSLTCMYPLNNKGKSILDVEYFCTENIEYGFTLGLPFGIILIVGTLIGIFAFVYRFEIVYAKHLWKMKRRNETNVKGVREESKFDAFVSYCAADRAWVMEKLVPTLEPPGGQYTLCLHERDFPLGSYIMDNIVDNIDKSKRVLFVLSNSFLGSEWCKWELRMATHRIFERSASDFLVLLELERLQRERVPLSLRVLLATRTYLEWHQNQPEVFWSRLKQTLGKPIARPMQEAEETPEPFKDVDELIITLEMMKRDPELLEQYTKDDEECDA